MGLFSFLAGQTIRPLTYAAKEGGDSLKRTKDMIVDAFNDMKAGEEQKSQNPSLQTAKDIKSDRERFAFLAQDLGWTPKQLQTQLECCRKSKAIYLAFVAPSLTISIWLISQGGLFGFLAGTMAFSLGLLFTAKAFQMALWALQIRESDLMTFQRLRARKGWIMELIKC